MLNDAKLLKKMQADYDTKIGLLIKDRDEMAENNFRARNRLLEVEFVTYSFYLRKSKLLRRT